MKKSKKNRLKEMVRVTLDDRSTMYIKKKNLSECPKCKEISVRGKELGEGGGVVCINDDCHYWFCY